MKPHLPHHLLIALAFCAIVLAGGQTRADSSLASFLFENNADLNLWGSAPASSQKLIKGNSPAIIPVSQGRNCLEFSMTGTAEGSRDLRTLSAIPVTPGTSRRIKLSFDIRSENCNPDDIVVRLLQQNASGGSAWVMGQTNYVKVAPSKGWVSMEKIGTLLDTTTRLYLYFVQTRGANTNGKIWIDNVSITLLSNNTDYLVEAYSGSQGNIFQADTGTMTVRSNDPGYSTLSVAVFDHTGSPVQPSVATVSYSTVETHKTATITFLEKGFYEVEASPNGSAPFKTWTAATIGAPVASTATEPLGMFSINSDNPSAEAAGSKWNRYFLQTELVYEDGSGGFKYPASYANARGGYAVGTSANWPSSMLYHSQSTNQKWIVCLRGIPDWLVVSNPVHARDNVNWKYHWQYYNDEVKFKEMMTWILKDLPADVEYVEAMNEPEWAQWGGTWTELGNYLKALKVAVTQANVGRALPLKLVGPCFAHLPTTSYPDNNSNYPPFATNKALLENLLVTQNVRDALDGIVMHAYHTGTDAPNNRPEGDFWTRLNEFKTYLGTIGMASKPVLITEYGWQSGMKDWQFPVSEAVQADYQARAMMIILSKHQATTFNITAALGFALQGSDKADGTTTRYSFLEPEGTPRLPYVAYARTAKELQPYSGARKLQYMSSMFNAFTATDHSTATVLALWSPTGLSSGIKLPAASISARDLYGHPKALAGTPKQVTINGSPTFVTVADSALGAWGSGPAYVVARGGSITVEFTDMLASSEFSLSGNTLSVSAGAGLGARNIIGKCGTVWKNYNVTVN